MQTNSPVKFKQIYNEDAFKNQLQKMHVFRDPHDPKAPYGAHKNFNNKNEASTLVQYENFAEIPNANSQLRNKTLADVLNNR